MPRKPDLTNAGAQSRTARWRARLRQAGRPEASTVDVEVAAAVAAYATEAAVDARLEIGTLRMLMRDAVDRLVARGYDREEAKRKVRTRLGRFAFVVAGERAAVSG